MCFAGFLQNTPFAGLFGRGNTPVPQIAPPAPGGPLAAPGPYNPGTGFVPNELSAIFSPTGGGYTPQIAARSPSVAPRPVTPQTQAIVQRTPSVLPQRFVGANIGSLGQPSDNEVIQ